MEAGEATIRPSLGSPQLEAGQLSLRLDSTVLLQPARLLKLVRLHSIITLLIPRVVLLQFKYTLPCCFCIAAPQWAVEAFMSEANRVLNDLMDNGTIPKGDHTEMAAGLRAIIQNMDQDLQRDSQGDMHAAFKDSGLSEAEAQSASHAVWTRVRDMARGRAVDENVDEHQQAATLFQAGVPITEIAAMVSQGLRRV